MFLTAYAGRTIEFDITLTDANANAITIDTIGDTDTVRVKIGRLDETPKLDLASSGSGTSTVTVLDQTTNTGQVRLRLDQTDMASLGPGAWEIEVAVVDDSDAEKIKHAETGVLMVHPTPSGGTGI